MSMRNFPSFTMPRTQKRPWQIWVMLVLLVSLPLAIFPQAPELQTALVKMGHVWVGVKANGDKGSFDYRAGFFPSDYDLLGIRGQNLDTWAGAGFTLTTTNWPDPLIADSIHSVAIYGPTNTFMPTGHVVPGGELTNFVRFGYPQQIVDFEEKVIDQFGVIDPDQFGTATYDQIVEVTTENILGVQLNRRVLAWSQTFHDDYNIVDVEFTNVSGDTLPDFYINIQSNAYSSFRSNGLSPNPPAGERYNPATTWQHYYGGRQGDSLRVFYEYSADDPDTPGDNMGAPIPSQGGRLLNANFAWYSILHASVQPYLNEVDDVDDFLQPRVTYIGKDNLIPYDNSSDEYGSSNFWAIRGAYSEFFPMSGNTWPGTFHGGNSDEQGSSDYSDHPAGTRQANNSKMWSSFGPYTFLPDHKLRLVLANGYSGINLEDAKSIGEAWLRANLTEPPDLPDPVTGYFPPNFVFPPDANEMDKVKDRWVSTVVDSVMQSASRAKWNFDTGYQVPAAPPPPSKVDITGLGTGVEIRWIDLEAEERPDFAGYRIMRKLSNTDTLFYQEVYNSGPEDIADEHFYNDTDFLLGAQYYYYVQAKCRISETDPNAYPASRGKIIYSNRVMHPNIQQVKPPAFSQDDLDKIAIVPNPFNLNDPLVYQQGWTDPRKIQFFNLPAQVTIKIFTENGDLVQLIEHDSPVSSGLVDWDMLTRNQQYINSGLYIVVFQTPDGRLSYQKFAVIR